MAAANMAAAVGKRARETELSPVILAALSRMQDGLNRIVDVDWRRKRCCDDWALAVTMESAELMDSYPWKWWKNINATPDFNNVKIELVDILHFALSGAMQMTGATTAPPHPAHEVDGGIRTPLSETRNAIATFRNVIRLADAHRFDTVTAHVVAAANDLGFNLVAYYIAKHTLNYIRQIEGYKSGTYKKVENGREDNELLHGAIEDIDIDSVLSDASYTSTWGTIMCRVYDAFAIAPTDRRDVNFWLDVKA